MWQSTACMTNILPIWPMTQLYWLCDNLLLVSCDSVKIYCLWHSVTIHCLWHCVTIHCLWQCVTIHCPRHCVTIHCLWHWQSTACDTVWQFIACDTDNVLSVTQCDNLLPVIVCVILTMCDNLLLNTKHASPVSYWAECMIYLGTEIQWFCCQGSPTHKQWRAKLVRHHMANQTGKWQWLDSTSWQINLSPKAYQSYLTIKPWGQISGWLDWQVLPSSSEESDLLTPEPESRQSPCFTYSSRLTYLGSEERHKN